MLCLLSEINTKNNTPKKELMYYLTLFWRTDNITMPIHHKANSYSLANTLPPFTQINGACNKPSMHVFSKYIRRLLSENKDSKLNIVHV